GAPPDRPAALVERATLPEQRVMRTQLADVARLARTRNVAAPALLIIGDVAAAAEADAIESLTDTLKGVA
ncbi:MAG TPA: hypothetical protein VGI35_00040, partial [Steroidobacteraceae bacterium]